MTASVKYVGNEAEYSLQLLVNLNSSFKTLRHKTTWKLSIPKHSLCVICLFIC